MIPTIEADVTGQCPQIIKEGFACGQMRSQQLVLLVKQLLPCVERLIRTAGITVDEFVTAK